MPHRSKALENAPAKTLGDLRRIIAEAKDFPDDTPIRALYCGEVTVDVADFGIISPPNSAAWFNIEVDLPNDPD